MVKMINKNLVGRCGHYCGACSIYRACEDGGELLEVMEKSCPPDRNIYCKGCQAVDETCWPYNHCKIRECLDAKGFDFCYECDEFEKGECEEWKRLAEGHAKIGMDLHENLLSIKSEGVEKWLREQDKKWRCSSCGKPISEEEKCYQCGTQLWQGSR
jgi:hypothetical protein